MRTKWQHHDLVILQRCFVPALIAASGVVEAAKSSLSDMQWLVSHPLF